MSLLNNERLGKSYIYTSTFISSFILVVIFAVLIINSLPALLQEGYFTTSNWNPPYNQFGIKAMIFGSLAVTIIALLISLPIGILSAIFISELIPKKIRPFFKAKIELLAGIPSIVYGLIGIAILAPFIEHIFNLQTGRTILTASILLSIMILPMIVTFCDDALNQIPNKYRETSLALGLTKYESIKTILPIAMPGIIGASLLATGRALGETMAVMLVIGSIDKIPSPVFNLITPGQTMTSKLGREVAEASLGSMHFASMIGLGLILLVLVIAITFISHQFFKVEDRLHE